jgi:hypothetical protein
MEFEGTFLWEIRIKLTLSLLLLSLLSQQLKIFWLSIQSCDASTLLRPRSKFRPTSYPAQSDKISAEGHAGRSTSFILIFSPSPWPPQQTTIFHSPLIIADEKNAKRTCPVFLPAGPCTCNFRSNNENCYEKATFSN